MRQALTSNHKSRVAQNPAHLAYFLITTPTWESFFRYGPGCRLMTGPRSWQSSNGQRQGGENDADSGTRRHVDSDTTRFPSRFSGVVSPRLGRKCCIRIQQLSFYRCVTTPWPKVVIHAKDTPGRGGSITRAVAFPDRLPCPAKENVPG